MGTKTGTIGGKATPDGTSRYSQRHVTAVDGYFRPANDLVVSGIGIGTYLGEPDEDYDRRYTNAVVQAVQSGSNVIDTAINYRFQRSERSVGAALQQLLNDGYSREEIIVCTKGGFIPFDGDYPSSARLWVDDHVVKPGLASPDEIVGGSHCMTPRYLRDQLQRSLDNMHLESIDVYYIHNPESQLGHVDEEQFYDRLTQAFEALEQAVTGGLIQAYGTATWSGYLLAPEEQEHLSLERVYRCAIKTAGDQHHFRFIQLPVNAAMPEAAVVPNQLIEDKAFTVIGAATELGLSVIGSGSLLQGRLVRALPAAVVEQVSATGSEAIAALQIARSTPGLAVSLVGMSSVEHVRDNLKIMSQPPLTQQEYFNLFQRADQ